MTAVPATTVIVLCRDRTDLARLTVLALRQQSLRSFQLVIVSNQVATLRRILPDPDRIVFVPFQEANVSAARNAGIAASCGDVIAFCDDDAVPEPKWLERLIAPFEDPSIGAVGGVVRGRNGVSLQWGPVAVDRCGEDHPLVIPDDTPVFVAKPDRARVPKTVGTCCAFRRDALVGIGGFDCAFRFYLDETDVNFRLAAAGWSTAIVPLAEVHHRFAASAFRTRMRVPTSLFEMSASKAYFCERHCPEPSIEPAFAAFRTDQRRRLIGFAMLGFLGAADIKRILATMEDGIAEGVTRRPTPGVFGPPVGGQSFVSGPAPSHRLILQSLWSRCRAEIAEAVAAGEIVTLFDLRPGTRMMTVRYQEPGLWVHRGGIWGRTDRNEQLFRPRFSSTAITNETERIAQQRGI